MRSRAVLLLLCFVSIAGCNGKKEIKYATSQSGVPSWVLKTPSDKDRLCAVGASEPTYYKEDAKNYAAESARRELARSLNVTVQSFMVDVNMERGGSAVEGGTAEVSSWVSEAVLRNSEISEYWYDESGAASFNRKNITYSLACMPMEGTLKEISLKLDGNSSGHELFEGIKYEDAR